MGAYSAKECRTTPARGRTAQLTLSNKRFSTHVARFVKCTRLDLGWRAAARRAKARATRPWREVNGGRASDARRKQHVLADASATVSRRDRGRHAPPCDVGGALGRFPSSKQAACAPTRNWRSSGPFAALIQGVAFPVLQVGKLRAVSYLDNGRSAPQRATGDPYGRFPSEARALPSPYFKWEN